jgi:predicted nucleic acid-binding protein
MKVEPAIAVLTWLNDSNTNELYLSSITIAEIAYGLQVLPDGNRRQTISARFAQFIERGFDNRILAFDEPAAFTYGDIMAMTRSMGRPMSVPDGQIAAIAKTHGMNLATRNISDFEATGLVLINPWS